MSDGKLLIFALTHTYPKTKLNFKYAHVISVEDPKALSPDLFWGPQELLQKHTHPNLCGHDFGPFYF